MSITKQDIRRLCVELSCDARTVRAWRDQNATKNKLRDYACRAACIKLGIELSESEAVSLAAPRSMTPAERHTERGRQIRALHATQGDTQPVAYTGAEHD